MEWKDYADFTVEDFLTDDFFMEWVLHPDRENSIFWEEWQRLYPEKKIALEEARSIMLSLEYQQHKMPEQSYDRIWHALHKKMDAAVLPDPHPGRRFQLKFIWYAAASVLSMFLAYYWWSHPGKEQLRYTSNAGESKRIVLPDSTVVVLAPHAQLRAAAFDHSNSKREVWLEGEAFFTVKGQTDEVSAFTVHAGALNIEVLGTEFNVTNHNGRTSVILRSGKIALQDSKQQKARIIMQPGEMIAFGNGADNYIKELVSPDEQTTSMQQALAFDHTPLEEVAVQLYRRYGIRLLFSDPTLKQEQFSITLKQPDYKIALKAIQEAFSLQLGRQDDSTYILSR